MSHGRTYCLIFTGIEADGKLTARCTQTHVDPRTLSRGVKHPEQVQSSRFIAWVECTFCTKYGPNGCLADVVTARLDGRLPPDRSSRGGPASRQQTSCPI